MTQLNGRAPSISDSRIWKRDIRIANKTVDQIKLVASSGNIVAGYGARFPWNACSDCRFHGTDGIALGNGTRIA